MKSRLYRFLLLGIALVGAGCAPYSPPPSPTFFRNPSGAEQMMAKRTYAASVDAVWNAAVQVVTDNQYSLVTIEKDSGVLTTDWVLVESRSPFGLEPRETPVTLGFLAVLPPTRNFLGEIGLWSKCRYKFSVRVTAEPSGSTQVLLTPHIECWEDQERKTWTPCESKGVLESQFFQSLETYVLKQLKGILTPVEKQPLRSQQSFVPRRQFLAPSKDTIQ